MPIICLSKMIVNSIVSLFPFLVNTFCNFFIKIIGVNFFGKDTIET